MKAKVSDVKGFTGGEAESSKDMTVAVDYTRDKLIKIELNLLESMLFIATLQNGLKLVDMSILEDLLD